MNPFLHNLTYTTKGNQPSNILDNSYHTVQETPLSTIAGLVSATNRRFGEQRLVDIRSYLHRG